MKANLKRCCPKVIASPAGAKQSPYGEASHSQKREIASAAFGGFAMTYVLMLILCVSLIGCGPAWKKKFVRKRAEKKPEQVFTYEPREYQGEPSGELYKRRFIFWKAWQEELVNELGASRKSDLRAFEEALENLGEMKDYLQGEKAAELEDHTKKLKEFYSIYKSNDLDIVRARQMRRDLDRLMLKIDKAFRYSRVKQFIMTNDEIRMTK